MNATTHWISRVGSAALLALLAALWIAFAPTQLGGNVSYILVNGSSMEPGFHRGDLAILRMTDAYHIGDVVTYRHPTIGYVIHRIVARNGDRFILQGDNNAWRDSYHPGEHDMVGTLWMHLPHVGTYVEQLRTPWILGLVVIVLGGVGMNTQRIEQSPNRRAPRRRRRTAMLTAAAYHGMWETVLSVLALVALASVVLGGFAFSRPTMQMVERELSYEHTGAFSYAAPAPAAVYAVGTAQTGDPIFRTVTDQVTIQFDYRLAATAWVTHAGTYRLIAEVNDTSGWTRTIELQPETSFDGTSFRVTGVLDLPHIQALIDAFEHQTGVQRQQYALNVVPQIRVRGTVDGQAREAQFQPRLVFTLDQLYLQVAHDTPRSGATYPVSQSGVVTIPQEQPTTLALLRMTVDVVTARRMALLGGALALMGLAGFALHTRAWHGDEAARIRARYGARIIDVQPATTGLSQPMIAVNSIDDLVKLADLAGGMILHVAGADAPRYVVHVDGVAYWYGSGS